MKREKAKLLKVWAKLGCGCCMVEMKFKDLGAAKAAFAKAGMGSGREVTDDTGKQHKGIDTFYGFSVDGAVQKARNLGYLVD